jgi:hypothetical protein
VEFIEAPWPSELSGWDQAVSVLLELVIGTDGTVTESVTVEVVDEAGVVVPEPAASSFAGSATEAVLQFRFAPAVVNGETVASRIRFRYDFTVEVVSAPVTESLPAFQGRVLDATTEQPLQDVEVRIGDLAVVTGAEGSFVFEELDAGVVEVELFRDPDVGPVLVAETITGDTQLEVVYRVELRTEESLEPGVLMEIVVRPPSQNLAASGTRMSAEAARTVPGSGGDVVRVVESMPGVARAGAGQGTLVVWGAAPEDTRVYLDGVPLPRLYHESGVRSVVHPQFVDSISLIPGGWGAPWGRGLGGIVLVETTTPQTEGVSGVLGADAYDASGAIAWLGKQGVSAGVAGRVGVIRPLARQFASESEEFVPVPQFWDVQARTTVELDPARTLTLAAIASGDDVQRGLDNADPAQVVRENRALSFARVYADYEAGDGDSTFEFTPWAGVESFDTSAAVGFSTTNDARDTLSAGARLTQRARVGAVLELHHGADVEWARTRVERQGSLALPPREGDPRVFGQAPPDQQASDNFTATTLSLAWWGEARLSNRAETLRLVPGLRLDPHIQSASRRTPVTPVVPEVGIARSDLRLEPRIQAEADLHRTLTLRSAFGQYHQFAAAADLSSVFGTPSLPVASARHALAGVTWRIGELLSMEATAFHSWSEDLAVRNASDSPAVSEALVASGSGRARGVQVLLRRELQNGVFGWVAWTVSRSERRDATSPSWRLFDYDQTHVGTAVLGWQPSERWDLSGRARYASGLPRTPVLGADYDATRDRYEPRFGGVNTIRLPSFVQLDLRAAHTFPLRTGKLMVYLEVLNVTNRANAEEFVFAPDFSERDIIRGLPVLPFMGAQWSF